MQLKKIKYNKLIAVISLFFALLISFWIPQYKFVLSLFISLWLLVSILQANYKQRFLDNYSAKKFVFFSLQISFFIIIILGYFISDLKDEAADIIVKKLSFFVFPLLFLFSGKQFSLKKHLFLKVFVAGNIIASIICIVYGFIHSLNFQETGITFNPINENGYSYFKYSLFTVFHHPAYFSMYLVFSIAILFYLKKNTEWINSAKRKLLFIITIIFFLIIIYLLSSRVGMLTAFILIIWKIIQYVKTHKSILIKLISIVIVIAGVFILSQNRRVIRTYKEVKYTLKDGKEYGYYPARLILWEASVEVIKENFWLGTGTGDAYIAISKKTELINFRGGKMRVLNAHNQFLETFLSSGFIGILVLLSIVIYSFLIAVKTKNHLLKIFLALMLFNFLFESMLNTIAGIVFFTYFMNYFIFVFNSDVKTE